MDNQGTKHQFSDEQVAEFREAFMIFDKDNDGLIPCKELGTVMRGLGQNPKESEIKEMIQEVDSDGNGTIEFTEFLILMSKRLNQQGNKQELIDAFKLIDKDCIGALPSYEFRYLMTTSGEAIDEEEIDHMLMDADTDGDGTISFDEFIRMMSL